MSRTKKKQHQTYKVRVEKSFYRGAEYLKVGVRVNFNID